MKNFKKIIFFMVILLMVSFSLISIFGIQTNWGNTTKHHFKGLSTLTLGDDIGDQAKITLNYEKDLDEEEKEEVEQIIKTRLNLMGFGEHSLSYDTKAKTITVTMPLSYSKPYRDINDIAAYISSQGKFVMKKTSKTPLQALYGGGGDSKDDVFLMDNSDINSVSLCYVANRNKQKADQVPRSEKSAGMKLSVSEEVRAKLFDLYTDVAQNRKDYFQVQKETTRLEKSIKKLEEEIERLKESREEEEDEKSKEEKEEKKEEDEKSKEEKKEEDEKSEEEKEKIEEKKEKEKLLKEKRKEFNDLQDYISKQNISIKIDNEDVYNSNVYDLFDENLNIVITNDQLSQYKILNFVNILKSTDLSTKLVVSDVSTVSAKLGLNFKENIIIFTILLILLLTIFATIKFKLIGALSFLNILGHVSFLIACFTGFFSFLPGYCLNLSAIIGIEVSLLLGFSTFIFLIDKISLKIKKDNNIRLCVKETYKENLKPLLKINFLILLLSSFLIGIFSPNTDIFSFIFRPIGIWLDVNIQNSIFSFAYAIFFGTIGNLIFQIFITNIILKFAQSFKFFKNVRLYGVYGGKTK